MSGPASLVVLLHGVGGDGHDLAPLASAWVPLLPRTAFASPDAPEPFGNGPGRQWFSIDGVTNHNRLGRVRAARTGFDALLTRVLKQRGFAQRLDVVALVGFSQGGTMALDAVASGRWPIGAVIALSGRLITPEPLDACIHTPILLVHGGADPVIPAIETERALAVLRRNGLDVQRHVLPGIGHTIPPEAVTIAGGFLSERFKP